MNDKIFVDGYVTNDIPDTAPDYILGKGAFHVKKLKKFLEDNEKHANANGWLNFVTKRSKEKLTRYTEIDFYKAPVNPTPEMVKEARENLANQTVEEVENNYPQEDPQEIPF